MKSKLGISFMIIGAALVLAALSLFLYNRHEDEKAAQASLELLPQLVAQIVEQSEEVPEVTTVIIPGTPVELLKPEDVIMKEIEIDGYGYIGYLSVPSLNLELPIMGDWDYTRLRIAPCRYSGTVLGEDLVIMAHNYSRHFGRLTELTPGDAVLFTDMDGKITQYQVVAQDVLPPTAVEEMTAGECDLTLFTCTYGGQSRVTIWCDRIGD